jgi:hypothetical protein
MAVTINGTSGITFPNASTQTAGADLIANTGASSDITLNMGQTAYVTFTSSTSIPLRIATATNQVYEINIISSGTAAGNLAFLLINNATGSVHNTFQILAPSTPASGSAGYNFLTSDTSFRVSVGGTLLFANATAFTTTANKSIIISGRDTTASVGYGYTIESTSTDTTTAWTSLGTITCSTALTGTVWIRRIG